MLGRRRFPGDVFHVDLLGPARRLWSARLADCRLGTVEQDVLGFLRDDDLPGALIPTVYFEYLRRKRPDELPRVFEHNRHDILSLAALTGWVADAVARAPHPELDPEALAGLGRMLEGADPERSLACYRLALDTGLPTPSRERLLLRLAHREKRLARWDEARALWEAAARVAPRVRPAAVGGDRQGPRASPARPRGGARGRGAGAGARPAAPGLRPRAASFEHRLERLGRRIERVAGLSARSAASLTPSAISTAPLAPSSRARQSRLSTSGRIRTSESDSSDSQTTPMPTCSPPRSSDRANTGSSGRMNWGRNAR